MKGDRWSAGQTVYQRGHGRGVIKQVDIYSAQFRYLVDFDDGTLKWVPVWEVISNEPIY